MLNSISACASQSYSSCFWAREVMPIKGTPLEAPKEFRESVTKANEAYKLACPPINNDCQWNGIKLSKAACG